MELEPLSRCRLTLWRELLEVSKSEADRHLVSVLECLRVVNTRASDRSLLCGADDPGLAERRDMMQIIMMRKMIDECKQVQTHDQRWLIRCAQ